jgi:hypothetical protein
LNSSNQLVTTTVLLVPGGRVEAHWDLIMAPKSKKSDSVLGDADIVQVDEFDDDDVAQSEQEPRVCAGHMIVSGTCLCLSVSKIF